MYLECDNSSEQYEEMISNEQSGLLNATVLLIWLTAVAIAHMSLRGML